MTRRTRREVTDTPRTLAAADSTIEVATPHRDLLEMERLTSCPTRVVHCPATIARALGVDVVVYGQLTARSHGVVFIFVELGPDGRQRTGGGSLDQLTAMSRADFERLMAVLYEFLAARWR
jgi:hypothetical protein